MSTGRRPRRKQRVTGDLAPAPFVAECVPGLEGFAADELGRRIPLPRPLPAAAERGGGQSGSPSPSRRRGGQGEGHPGGTPGELRFDYAGPWRALLELRMVVAVHAVVAADLPRPSALLDDGRLRQIASTIGHIRSLHPAGAFRTFRLSAAGAESSAFTRFRARLAEPGGLAETDGPGDLLLRFRRVPDRRFELLARISPRPLTARAWRVCNLPGALNGCVAAVMAHLTRPSPDDVYVNLACGSGTLLVERAELGPAGRLIGCDLAAEALACATKNVAAAGLEGIELEAWDATALPLEDGSVDALTVDLPFGQLVGSHGENAELYPRLLAEAARVARSGARFVAITHQSRLFERSVDAGRWTVEGSYRPRLPTQAGSIAVGLFLLERR